MRKPIIVGNWKMNKTNHETEKFFTEFKPLVEGVKNVEIVIGAPFTALETATRETKGTNIKIAAENMNANDSGAYTGEISPLMLKDLGVEYVILGHSERREYYGETDSIINEKVKAALKHGLKPILCVGEKLEERENGTTEAVVKEQTVGGLKDVSASDMSNVVIAYEPVWAIGTGETASPEQAQEMHKFIRTLVEKVYGFDIADNLTILYGGSVKPDNAKEIFSKPDVDGGLIGGAALKADDFLAIVNGF